MRAALFRSAAALLLAAACSLAHAQGISLERGSGYVQSVLRQEASVFARAMRRGQLEEAQRTGVEMPGKVLSRLRQKTAASTVAYFEYTPPGEERPVRVHARSGRSVRFTLDQLARRGEATSGGSGTDTSASGREEAIRSDEAQDLNESRLYPPDTPEDIRARIRRPVPGGVVEVRAVDGSYDHFADAELKALREYEYLFAERQLQPGGRLVGYVSQTVCPSCSANIDAFASKYGVTGTVYALDETQVAADAADMADPVAASRRAAAMLKQQRRDDVRDLFKLPKDDVALESSGWRHGLEEADELLKAENESLEVDRACTD
jgi:hypothetical protein